MAQNRELSVLSEVVQLFVTQKRKKNPLFLKFSNFANSWSWELKFLQDRDLVLKRTNPGSFFDPMIFGTPVVIVLKISEIFCYKL